MDWKAFWSGLFAAQPEPATPETQPATPDTPELPDEARAALSEELATMAAKLETAKREAALAQASAVVDAALQQGKAYPAERAALIDLYVANPNAVEQLIASRPSHLMLVESVPQAPSTPVQSAETRRLELLNLSELGRQALKETK